MLDNLGGWEIVALLLVALFVIGPERLPKVISDALGLLRRVRTMARNATGDLSRELGTTIELEDLHPKTFLRKHLLSEAEEDALRKPFQDLVREAKDVVDSFDLSKELSTGSVQKVEAAASAATAAAVTATTAAASAAAVAKVGLSKAGAKDAGTGAVGGTDGTAPSVGPEELAAPPPVSRRRSYDDAT